MTRISLQYVRVLSRHIGRWSMIACSAFAGLGVAIGAEAQQVRITTQSQQGWIGVYLTDRITNDTSQYPVIMSVEPGSPAQAAGILSGDTLLGFNGIDARGNFRKLQQLLKPGDRITLKLRRNGLRSATVTVAKREEGELRFEIRQVTPVPPINQAPIVRGQITASVITLQARLEIMGAELAELNPELSSALHVKNNGVLVISVASESPAKEAGLQGGDVIVKADGVQVSSAGVLLKAIQHASSRVMTLEITRKGKTEKKKLQW